jgi:16S rRNA (cytidine1402-2'-O)-methyltransferase
MAKTGLIYLFPTALGEVYSESDFVPENLAILDSIDLFAVENMRSARRFLRKIGYTKTFSDSSMIQLTEKDENDPIPTLIQRVLKGHHCMVLSEAGSPAIADPGAKLVEKAHEKGIPVKPLVGPSSIFLALMASGMNGQGFTFHGYLPRKQADRIRAIRIMEKDSKRNGYTQLFMETPYRNQSLFEDLLDTLSPYTQLSIASHLTQPQEKIGMRMVKDWNANTSLHKKPAIFAILA